LSPGEDNVGTGPKTHHSRQSVRGTSKKIQVGRYAVCLQAVIRLGPWFVTSSMRWAGGHAREVWNVTHYRPHKLLEYRRDYLDTRIPNTEHLPTCEALAGARGMALFWNRTRPSRLLTWTRTCCQDGISLWSCVSGQRRPGYWCASRVLMAMGIQACERFQEIRLHDSIVARFSGGAVGSKRSSVARISVDSKSRRAA
jgi:hypothetical protein